MSIQELIEFAVELLFDYHDRRFVAGPMEQAEYDEQAAEIQRWYEREMEGLRT